MPKGPPPENPSVISVDGGITYMDVHWERVSLKCPDLVYQVTIFILSFDHHLLQINFSKSSPLHDLTFTCMMTTSRC